MKKVLITGAAGFIGRHCLPILLTKGYEVHAADSRESAENVPDVCWHQVDLLNSLEIRRLMGEVGQRICCILPGSQPRGSIGLREKTFIGFGQVWIYCRPLKNLVGRGL